MESRGRQAEGRARPRGRADFLAGEVEPVPARRTPEASWILDKKVVLR